MPTNLELYRLELTAEPYQAQFITTAEISLPPECVLPAPLADIPPLPNLDLSLPPLGCNFNIDVPLIPPPHFCVPEVSGSITITSPAFDVGEPGITVTGSASIARVVGSECDYALDGNFEFSLENVCNKQFVVRQEVISSDCNGPTLIRVIWESNCTVLLNGVGVLASDFRDYTASSLLTFQVTCCELKIHTVNVLIPSYTSGASGSVTIEAETAGGPVSLGTISVAASSCGVVMQSTPNPIIIPMSGNVVDVDGTIPGISTSCVSSADWLHLSKSIGVDDEVIIELTGNFPKPCFTCDATNTGGTYVSTIEADILKPKQINFNNTCCTNTYSYWDDCGKRFKVGDYTVGGDHGFNVDMSISNSAIKYTHEGLLFQMTKLELKPPIDAGVQGVRPRVLDVCQDGNPKKMIVLCSQPYTPA